MVSRWVKDSLERLPRGDTVEPLKQEAPAPLVSGFNWRQVRFGPRLDELDQLKQNGMALSPVVTNQAIEDDDYRQWLRTTGIQARQGEPTLPEYRVFRALERLGLHAPQSQPIPGLDFIPFAQVFAGGGLDRYTELDMLVQITAPPVAIRVQGEYFHYKDVDLIAADILQRLALEGEGYRVVDILAQDTEPRGRCDYVTSLALRGYEVDTSGKLGVFR